MPKYRLEIFCDAIELCWYSLTKVQAEYWKSQIENRLEEYIFNCDPESRVKLFRDIPKNAHITGHWWELDDILHAHGPVWESHQCTLYEIKPNGGESQIWTSEVSDFDSTDYGEYEKEEKPKLKSKYILACECYEQNTCVGYTWNDVSKKPNPSDFATMLTTDDKIYRQILLFGKSADEITDANKGSICGARVVLADELLYNGGI